MSSEGCLGSFIHPSAYLVLDHCIQIFQKSHDWPFLSDLNADRAKVITHEQEVFWSRPIDDPDRKIDRVRILICGSSGAGKSTIVNKTFGREVVSLFPRVMNHGRNGLSNYPPNLASSIGALAEISRPLHRVMLMALTMSTKNAVLRACKR